LADITQLFINFRSLKDTLKETATVTPAIGGALQRPQGQEGQLGSVGLSPEPLSTWQVPAHEAAPALSAPTMQPKKQ